MPEIFIPFDKGQYEAADAKLLPDGYFSGVKNTRFQKDGRIGSRIGYTPISGSPGKMLSTGVLDKNHIVTVKDRESSTVPPTAWLNFGTIAGSTATTAATSLSGVSAVGVPRRAAVGRNLKYTTVASDTGVSTSSTVIYTVYQDFDYASSTNRGIVVSVTNIFGIAKGSVFISATGRNPKLVSNGSDVMVVYSDSDAIKYALLNGATISSSGTLVTATAGRGFAFDASPNGSANTFLLVYETSAVNMRWGTVTYSLPSFTTRQDQVIANPARPSIARGSSGNVAVVWAEGATFNAGNVNYLVSTQAGAAVTAKTVIDNTGLAVGFPVAGPNTTDNYSFAWNKSDKSMGTFTPSIGVARYLGWMAAVSKPFTGPNNGCFLWCTNFVSSGQLTSQATYHLVDIESVQVNPQGAVCEAVSCQREAMPGAYMTTSATNQTFIENRRNVVLLNTAVFSGLDTTGYAVSLPVRTDLVFGVDTITMINDPLADRLFAAKLNGQMFFSGARVHEYDGSSFFESGLNDGPEYVTATDAGSGGLSAGDYDYCVVYKWVDANGYTHRSPPSAPVTITLADARSVQLVFSSPAFSARYSAFSSTGPSPGITFEVYRTLVDEAEFHLVNDSVGIPITAAKYDNSTYTYTDTLSDALLEDNELLYTQGVQGGLSGILENEPPPPCRYMWAGNNRLIMGGMENKSEIRWSKLVLPGEPVTFSSNPAFRGSVDGEVLGVACLDGVWYVGTDAAIWSFDGQGPDDNGGGGDFGQPRKVPSSVGWVSQRSLVETPDGLMFQGNDGNMYLLPRGGGAPFWIGQPVRDLLLTYPFVTATTLQSDNNLVIWACTTSTPGGGGILLVYDLRNKQWSYDLPFEGSSNLNRVFRTIACVFSGETLSLDGYWSNSFGYTDTDFASVNRLITCQLDSGDIRPFGLTGWGRVRRMTILGEARDVLTAIAPTLAVSYDSGKTYTDTASWTIANLATAIGDSIEMEHMLLYPKGDSYRVRLSWTTPSATEGIVWNGLSLEATPEKGLARQPNARRA